jgi:hypothetical protein
MNLQTGGTGKTLTLRRSCRFGDPYDPVKILAKGQRMPTDHQGWSGSLRQHKHIPCIPSHDKAGTGRYLPKFSFKTLQPKLTSAW